MSKFIKPSNKQIKKYQKKWKTLANGKYKRQESVLKRLFTLTCPNNRNYDDILAKVTLLNMYYSTNIISIETVAEHIKNLNIDKRLKKQDSTLIRDIASIRFKNTQKYFYSFATKYCSHHKPDIYPIYDRYVNEALWYFSKEYNFKEFKRKELRDYVEFVKIIDVFKEKFKLKCSYKELDRYLWQIGKEIYDENHKPSNNNNNKR